MNAHAQVKKKSVPSLRVALHCHPVSNLRSTPCRLVIATDGNGEFRYRVSKFELCYQQYATCHAHKRGTPRGPQAEHAKACSELRSKKVTSVLKPGLVVTVPNNKGLGGHTEVGPPCCVGEEPSRWRYAGCLYRLRQASRGLVPTAAWGCGLLFASGCSW